MLLPSVEDFALLLQKCRNERSLEQALRVHTSICQSGLDVHPLLGNNLVVVLVDTGSLGHARHVFDKLMHRRELSWSSLMSGHVRCGEWQCAVSLYQQMQHWDLFYPSGHTLVILLKACTMLKDMEQAQQLVDEIMRQGLLETDVFVGSSLVDLYTKCGNLAKAQEVFDKLPIKDVVAWTALIAGYTEHDLGEEALDCIGQMTEAGIVHDVVTYLCSLKACSCIANMNRGKEIHGEVIKLGLDSNLLIGSSLVNMYGQGGGLLAEANEVFAKFLEKDVVLWNAFNSALAAHGHAEEALECVGEMHNKGILPDPVTFVCSLKACAGLGDVAKGHEIHWEIVSRGFDAEPFVGNILVDMYAKFGLLISALDVFDKLPARDVVTWTVLVAGYVEGGYGSEALHCFKKMQDDGVGANDITFLYILKACGHMGATLDGLKVHAEIIAKGMENIVPVGNTLVDMYQQLGSPVISQQIFNKLKVREVASWNVLMAGYVEHGHSEKALDCFDQMQREGGYSTDATFCCILQACGSTEATLKGQNVHMELVRKGLETGLSVNSILVEMYGKCGLLADAYCVFAMFEYRDKVLWNALIAAYAQVGKSEEVVQLFNKMTGEGFEPDLATFGIVLNACSHTGVMDQGHTCFEAMSNGFLLTCEHYTCIVDLLGRAGHIERAVAVVEKMPMHPDIVVWHTLLTGCRKWGSMELGRHSFEHAVQLNDKGATSYLCMYNIYAEASLSEDRKTRFKEELDMSLAVECA